MCRCGISDNGNDGGGGSDTAMAATAKVMLVVAAAVMGAVTAIKTTAQREITYVFFLQIHYLRRFLCRPHTDRIPDGLPAKVPAEQES